MKLREYNLPNSELDFLQPMIINFFFTQNRKIENANTLNPHLILDTVSSNLNIIKNKIKF
jgi:hypothetical protein